jgi:hypothetical protein
MRIGMGSTRSKLLLVCISVSLLSGVAPWVRGDWEDSDGWKMHWPQTPDLSDTSMDVSMFQVPLADDFNCTETGPITDIHIWGSFAYDLLPSSGAGSMTIKLTICSDIPAGGTNPWSKPGAVLWSKVFLSGEYAFRQLPEEVWQDWYDPEFEYYEQDNNRLAFQYNFYVDGLEAFRQYKGTIYWLMVEDLTPVEFRDYAFGWKTAEFNLRWNDDAACLRTEWYPLAYPTTHEYDGNSLDLAFVINSRLPEPNMPWVCADLGDAPDSSNSWPVPPMTAYPAGGPPGVIANFPTVYITGSPPYGPIHWRPLAAHFGRGVSREPEADIGDDDDGVNNIKPPQDESDLDLGDDGIGPLVLPYCGNTSFDYIVTITREVPPLYTNVWFDWNRDGDWDEVGVGCATEWAVRNQLVPYNTPGVYKVRTPSFMPWHPAGIDRPPIWMRITLSTEQWFPTAGVNGDGGSGPAGGYEYGETEDYYLLSSQTDPDYFIPRVPKPGGLRGYYYDNINFTGYRMSRIDPRVNFDWGWGSPDPDLAIGSDSFSVRWVGEVDVPSTGTYTFYTISDDGVRLWVDNQLVVDRWVDQPPTESSGTISLVGGRRYSIQMDYYENWGGAVARLEWSGPGTSRQTVPQSRLSPPSIANNPNPLNDGWLNPISPILSWDSGEFAVGHDVYFGTDYSEVNDATPSDWEYRGDVNIPGLDGRFNYDAGALQTGQTYYWRIDEVYGLQVWKGNVWRFTVQDYAVCDDFERYVGTGLPAATGSLRTTWIDGYWDVTSGPPVVPGTSGSFTQLNTDPFDGTTNPANISRSGSQSMKFYYDNDGTITWLIDLYGLDPNYQYAAPGYSEAFAAVDDAARLDPYRHESMGLRRDWNGYRLLKLSYYGDPSNAPETMYVGFWDGDNVPSAPVVVNNPDVFAAQRSGWHDWYIPLQDFVAANPQLNLANVSRIYIGFGERTATQTGGTGVVFFDDIQLLTNGVCIPGTVAGDFDNDCAVNSNDLRSLAEVWLGQEPTTLAPPIIQLDASGLTYGPLPSWTNVGTLGGVFSADPLDAGTWPTAEAVEFRNAVTFNNRDFMVWDQNAPLGITGSSDFTVIYEVWNLEIAFDEEVIGWSQRDGPEGTYATFNYGWSNDYGAAAHWGWPDMGFGVLGVPPAHAWHTIAITYQGGTNGVETIIVDGVIRNAEAKTLAIRDNQWVALGAGYSADAAWSNTWTRGCRPADWTRYSGAVSSIRVYDYYIPPDELIMLTGSPIDLYRDVDNIINFMDFAVLANNWLVGPVLLGQ